MIDISFRYSKSAQKLEGTDPVAFSRIENAVGLARAAAAHVKERVFMRGDLKGHAKPYATKAEVYMSKAYAEAAGNSVNKHGKRRTWYKNSKEFHQDVGTKRGTYNVTGGMWQDNPKVRNYGNRGEAIIEFTRSSLGRRVKYLKSGKSKGRKVTNRLKAGSIFGAHRVNVIATTSQESDAIVSAVTWRIHKVLREIFGLKEGQDYGVFEMAGDRRLFERITKQEV